jgi:hypothetical protein
MCWQSHPKSTEPRRSAECQAIERQFGGAAGDQVGGDLRRTARHGPAPVAVAGAVVQVAVAAVVGIGVPIARRRAGRRRRAAPLRPGGDRRSRAAARAAWRARDKRRHRP